MKKIQQIMERAAKSCSEQGERLTEKRKRVLWSLLQQEKALSAYEIIHVYEQEFGESLPAMSAYRMLEFLEQQELIHRLELTQKYVACTHITCDHDHQVPQFIICKECSTVTEATLSKTTLNQLEQTVIQSGFHLLNRQLELNCICDACRKKAHSE